MRLTQLKLGIGECNIRRTTMIIHKRDCPCADCMYYESNKNGTIAHYCNKVGVSISQHHGSAFHSAGQWLIPCGAEFKMYKSKEVNNG